MPIIVGDASGNPATVTDIESRWRPLSEGEQTIAQALLDDAWAIILSHIPDASDQLGAEPPTLDSALVRVVVARMVLRVMRNPDGKLSEQIDDYKFTRDESRAGGDLYISDDEMAMLTPASATGAFSIRPSYVPDDLASMQGWRESLW